MTTQPRYMTPEAGALGWSDAARRISDAINQAIIDGHRSRWLAFALEDGRTNGEVYETKPDAVRHLANAYRKHMIVVVPWDGCPPRAAEIMLKLHRQLAANGQHPDDDLAAKTELMTDTRLEAYPEFDPRRAYATKFDRHGRPERRTRGGVILP